MNRTASLHKYTTNAMTKPFRPGRHDCALFAAGWVEEVTGLDLARGLRGYRTLAAGEKKLREAGYENHVEVAARHLTEIPVLMAQVGDLGVVPGDDSPALGIVSGDRVWVLRLDGLGHVPLTFAVRAFRV